MTTSFTAVVGTFSTAAARPPPDPIGIGTGHAIDPTTGATNERERHAMTRANAFVALRVLGRRRADHLATIDPADAHQVGRRAYTPSGGTRKRYIWRATDVNGGHAAPRSVSWSE